jgi:hypothetical protein
VPATTDALRCPLSADSRQLRALQEEVGLPPPNRPGPEAELATALAAVHCQASSVTKAQ